MQITGFTFVRNGAMLGYPFEASIRSLMNLCDEVVVNVGVSEDDTFQRVQALDDGRLILFESRWDDSLRSGGRVLAQQTNLSLERCRGDWLLYLQADEVVHEDDYDQIQHAIQLAENRPEVDGLLFRYLHFYGSFQTIATSRRWYRREIRAFKNHRSVSSYKDAQGFRKDLPKEGDTRNKGQKLTVIDSKARVFHYGWVRPPELMVEKTRRFRKLYAQKQTSGAFLAESPHAEPSPYESDERTIPFRDSHPTLMKTWLDKQDWDFTPMQRWLRFRNLRRDLLDLVERWTKKRLFEYRNYRLIR